jgi:hypothetical protein
MATALDRITHCFARLDDSHIIDAVNPETGAGLYGGKTLAETQAERPGAELLTLAEWQAHRGGIQRGPIMWETTTEEEYNDMMNVLPPAAYGPGAFLVGEPADHEADSGKPRYQAYRSRGLLFERSNRPLTRSEFHKAI